MAADGQLADLVLGNNVLAQVPDLNDFVAGIPHILKPDGTVTIEFPHVMRLIEENQFDTIYHEHFCYFSLTSAEAIFARHGMTIFDVEELWTHGGSLRIYARPRRRRQSPGERAGARAAGPRGGRRLPRRRDLRSLRGAGAGDQARVARAARSSSSATARSIVGYGAPGKGNTLLNYCGIRTDFIDFTVDRNPYKQGRFLPGHAHPDPRPGAASTRSSPTTS